MPDKIPTLTTKQLAERWQLHPGHLARLRMEGKGPPYFRSPGGSTRSRCLYRLSDVEAYEETHLEGKKP